MSSPPHLNGSQPQQVRAIPIPPGAPDPGPTPLGVQTTAAQLPNGDSVVILQFFSPTGAAIFHLHPEGAEAFAVDLAQQAKVAKTGLTIVGDGGLV